MSVSITTSTEIDKSSWQMSAVALLLILARAALGSDASVGSRIESWTAFPKQTRFVYCFYGNT
jgi:hypothetical protein